MLSLWLSYTRLHAHTLRSLTRTLATPITYKYAKQHELDFGANRKSDKNVYQFVFSESNVCHAHFSLTCFSFICFSFAHLVCECVCHPHYVTADSIIPTKCLTNPHNRFTSRNLMPTSLTIPFFTHILSVAEAKRISIELMFGYCK